MSTRREVILSWLCEKRQTWRLCYLLGEAGEVEKPGWRSNCKKINIAV